MCISCTLFEEKKALFNLESDRSVVVIIATYSKQIALRMWCNLGKMIKISSGTKKKQQMVVSMRSRE